MAVKTRKEPLGLLPAGVLLVLIGIALLAGHARAENDGRIQFGDDLLKALRRGQAEQMVTIVYFSMPSCSWCLKMEATTFIDRKVQAQSSRFVWVKVDPNFEPALAALFRVGGVPYFVFIDTQMQIVATYTGYITPEEMAKLLRDSADKAVPGESDPDKKSDLIEKLTQAMVASGQTDQASQALTAVVERLAGPEPCDRKQIFEAIRKLGPNAWSGLCALLGDNRLAVRAAAGQALAYATGADLNFDPFADAGTRSEQVATWKAWIQRRLSAPDEPEADPPAEQKDPREEQPKPDEQKSPAAGDPE